MSGAWPALIDPAQLADQGTQLSGTLPLTAMPRLAELSLDRRGAVVIDLTFDTDAGAGLRRMRGQVRADLYLTCQRCLEPMTLTLEITPRLTLLRPGERTDLAGQEETFVCRRAVPVSALIEDELLLAMPMIPKHALNRCSAKSRVANAASVPPPPGNRPFAALRTLKPKDR